jgi:hypothetical protein
VCAFLDIPLYETSHQVGHVIAATASALQDAEVSLQDFLNNDFLALHVSGGTTDLLYVKPNSDNIISIERIGGSSDANAGQILFGEDTSACGDGSYYSVILQGVCDDGSAADVEITRCIPSLDDDLEFGTSETPEVTLALNPIIYNASRHSADGYPQYTVRMGENDPTKKQRLNTTTGEYADV